MKKLKDMFKWKVDERQKLDLLKAEHYSFWFMYWMLFISIFYQLIFTEGGWKQVEGEWFVFMISSVFLLIACIRKGLWSFGHRKVPGVKSYLLYSLAAAVLAGGLTGLNVGVKHDPDMVSILLSAALTAVFTFGATFVLFLIVGGITKSREKKLAKLAEDDEDDE